MAAEISDAPPRAPPGLDFGAVNMRALPRVVRRIIGQALAEAPSRVALAASASLVGALASLALPRLLGRAVDLARRLGAAAQNADAAREALLTTAVLVVLTYSVRGLCSMTANYQAEWVSQKVAYRYRLKFFQRLQTLSFSFHDRVHSGDLITRGMLDLEGVRAFIQNGVMTAVSLALLLGVAAWRMFAADARMAVIGLAFTPVAGVVLARMGFLLRVTWLEVQRLMSVLTLIMEENLQGVRVVRAFAARAFELAKFDRAADAALAFSYRRIVLRYRAVSAMTLSFYASMGVLLWVGGERVEAGTMTAGQLTEFLAYLMLLSAPIRQIAMIFASAARATSSGGRLFEVLDYDPEIAEAPDAPALAVRDGVLRFEHVSFAYLPGRAVLNDVSFEVRPGRTLGIVGPPGAGKSTIAQLIPRFYDVASGHVTIDGQDVRSVSLSSLRRYVGLVQQETFLFDSTATNNIAYADPWAQEERIEAAARTAQIHDYLSSLPAAYETLVGERGVALSGGQRQRMSIARGVTPGPGIIIFDDSTAAIDAVTERRVREELAAATSAKATIIIAHRLSSLMHADEILVLEDGRIVERGAHADLLALGREYADLWAIQTRTAQGLSIADAPLRRSPSPAVTP